MYGGDSHSQFAGVVVEPSCHTSSRLRRAGAEWSSASALVSPLTPAPTATTTPPYPRTHARPPTSPLPLGQRLVQRPAEVLARADILTPRTPQHTPTVASPL